jgi:hypothetical protein
VVPEEPRFSWRSDTNGRGVRQTAYRVVVARTQTAVENLRGECWDSGRVQSAQSQDVAYDGVPLADDETYYWTVRIWNEEGGPSSWAAPTEFSTALATSADWEGEWIAHQPGVGDANGFRTPWRPAEADPTEWVQVDLGEEQTISSITLSPTEPFDGPIVDFGQNLTGWVRIDVSDLADGDRVELTHAEALTEDGNLSRIDLRSADARDAFVASGDEDAYEPRFTYHGFRYAQVDGYPRELTMDDLVARVVHTDASRTGTFECANEELTQVQQNAQWGMRGNLHSVPTDCPQRDERFGWTGDGRWTAHPRILNFDMVRAFEKWMDDHDDAQSRHGYVADTVPYGFGDVPEDPSWVLAAHYEEMRRYVDYWWSVSDDGVLPAEYGTYGDWLDFANPDSNVGEPLELFNTAPLLEATQIFADVATALDYESDATEYRTRAERIADAFNEAFFDPDAGRYEPYTQAAQALPLHLEVVPEDHDEAVLDALVDPDIS